MAKFFIQKDKSFKVPCELLPVAFRSQPYAPGLTMLNADVKHAWPPFNFMYKPDTNRWVPVENKIETSYFGFRPLAVFIETTDVFRLIDRKKSQLGYETQKQTLKFSKSELRKREIITFKLKNELNLYDLCSDESLAAHRLKLDDDVFCSTDLSESHEFADLIYEAGFDGILSRTRQGLSYSATVFASAKSKLEDIEILERKDILTVLKENDGEKILRIKIIDDEQLV